MAKNGSGKCNNGSNGEVTITAMRNGRTEHFKCPAAGVKERKKQLRKNGWTITD